MQRQRLRNPDGSKAKAACPWKKLSILDWEMHLKHNPSMQRQWENTQWFNNMKCMIPLNVWNIISFNNNTWRLLALFWLVPHTSCLRLCLDVIVLWSCHDLNGARLAWLVALHVCLALVLKIEALWSWRWIALMTCPNSNVRCCGSSASLVNHLTTIAKSLVSNLVPSTCSRSFCTCFKMQLPLPQSTVTPTK